MIPNPESDSSPRRRGRLIGALTVSLVVVVVIAIAVVVVSRPSSHKTVFVADAPTSTTTDPTHALDCTLPTLQSLTGPAATALRGGAAVSSLQLDSGKFVVAAPAPGQTPSITATQAECAALSSTGPNGDSIAGSAQRLGLAIGYGLVTVAPNLGSQGPVGVDGGPDPSTNPKLPAPARYDSRLAWVVVVEDPPVAACPDIPAVTSTSGATSTSVATPPTPPGNGYVAFVLDANTGADALLYSEGGPPLCGGAGLRPPTVSVPAELVSVPWQLVSRAADQYAGTISISVLPCDGHPGVASIDRDHPAVQVVVQRPFAASCGAPTSVKIPLHAAIVTADLPAQIEHDPVGLVMTPADGSEPGGPTPGATSGVLHQLDPVPAAGTTIELHVNDVAFLPDAYTGDAPNLLPATSSDPAVLGLLDGSRNEYRAWQPGRADLTLASTFRAPGAAPQVVHIVVSP